MQIKREIYMKKIILGCFLIIFASGCTTLRVTAANNLDDKKICVINNKSVREVFAEAYINQIKENGYQAKLINHKDKSNCTVTSTYTATYGMHWGTYLATADLKIFNNGLQVGQAIYKAPFASPAKHGRVEGKIADMLDKLLPPL